MFTFAITALSKIFKPAAQVGLVVVCARIIIKLASWWFTPRTQPPPFNPEVEDEDEDDNGYFTDDSDKTVTQTRLLSQTTVDTDTILDHAFGANRDQEVPMSASNRMSAEENFEIVCGSWKDEDIRHLAARRIQKNFRGYLARKNFKNIIKQKTLLEKPENLEIRKAPFFVKNINMLLFNDKNVKLKTGPKGDYWVIDRPQGIFIITTNVRCCGKVDHKFSVAFKGKILMTGLVIKNFISDYKFTNLDVVPNRTFHTLLSDSMACHECDETSIHRYDTAKAAAGYVPLSQRKMVNLLKKSDEPIDPSCVGEADVRELLEDELYLLINLKSNYNKSSEITKAHVQALAVASKTPRDGSDLVESEGYTMRRATKKWLRSYRQIFARLLIPLKVKLPSKYVDPRLKDCTTRQEFLEVRTRIHEELIDAGGVDVSVASSNPRHWAQRQLGGMHTRALTMFESNPVAAAKLLGKANNMRNRMKLPLFELPQHRNIVSIPSDATPEKRAELEKGNRMVLARRSLRWHPYDEKALHAYVFDRYWE